MTPGPDRPSSRRSPPEGAPEVFTADEQDAVAVDLARLGDLARHVLEAEGVRGAAELSLYFVDEAAITDLNRRFLGADGPTDVLAFPLDDDVVGSGRAPDGGAAGPDRPVEDPSDLPVLLGDVAVCPAVAARNAAERNRDLADELALLVVHGILHVLGHDHADPPGAAAMGGRQREHLRWYDPTGRAADVADPEAPPAAEAAPPS